MTDDVALQISSTVKLELAEPVPVDEHPVMVYLATLSADNSRHTMFRGLCAVAGVLTGTYVERQRKGETMLVPSSDPMGIRWSAIRYQHVAAIKAKLSEMYKPATVNTFIAALRGVLLATKNLGMMSLTEYDRAVGVKGVQHSTLPAGRDLDAKEIRRLFAACENDPTPAGARDAAILACLRVGLRVSEVVKLTMNDWRSEESCFVVSGKGQKERTVPLHNGHRQALNDWLTIRGDHPGPVFLRIRKGGNVEPAAISRQAVFLMLKKRAGEAKVSDFSPHDMRRTFVGDLLDAGVDIVTVKDLAGHASVTTTARYDRRGEQRKHDAMKLLQSHYAGRRQMALDE